MVLKWLLFETKVGELLLAFVERRAGLAVVNSEWLAGQSYSEPRPFGGQ
jgi:hypothetical protein